MNAQTMIDLESKAQARVIDIVDFASDGDEIRWFLEHYTQQRNRAIDDYDEAGAILAEYICTGLEKALAQ